MDIIETVIKPIAGVMFSAVTKLAVGTVGFIGALMTRNATASVVGVVLGVLAGVAVAPTMHHITLKAVESIDFLEKMPNVLNSSGMQAMVQGATVLQSTVVGGVTAILATGGMNIVNEITDGYQAR